MTKRASLSFGDDEPKPKPKPKPKSSNDLKRQLTATAKEQGFDTLHDFVDGRTLRTTGRNMQMNIAVRPPTKDRFWNLAKARDIKSGEEMLLLLMDELERRESD
jgi:hypothetical protein